MLTFGSLFAGIGGFDLGFEIAGMECRWQVEIDPYCQRVLDKNWPNVRRWDDVRTFPPAPAADWSVDVICGGFPCQDISTCNHKGKGLAGEKSGLWFEFERIIREMRPAIIVAENVSALLVRGLDQILCGLAKIGYDAEWQTLPASAFGAPHRRDRVFVVAYLPSKRFETHGIFDRVAHKKSIEKSASRLRQWPGRAQSSDSLPGRIRWCPDSELFRMVAGVPDRLDRYRGVGNSVCPVVAEWLGKRIVEAFEVK